ncbi:MAG: diguanylate cyclase, partial [Oscillospiraceae bacterium]|nr:diguanylate cyclase [Oscillospiraceae bacterium]
MTKILIVDDEAMMRMVAKRILYEQYEILTASSGKEAIQIYEKEQPALILSDILMPEMSGFEMHDKLRSMYGDLCIMFMTADESQTTADESQNRGAVGFIRKPFQPNILLRRVEQLLGDSVNAPEADTSNSDALTGLPTKDGLRELMIKACNEKSGTLMILDIDCFKLVNDIYGHNIGDILLQGFAEIIRANTRFGDIIGRVSNDEFVTFINHVSDEKAISSITSRINNGLVDYAHELMGEAMSIPLGVSVGAVYVPDSPCDYDELFNSADKALYSVKQSGKHGHAVYRNQQDEELD